MTVHGRGRLVRRLREQGWQLERPNLARQHSEGVMDAEKLSREMEEKI
jgi:hypothetical protein